jgi:hypothetical protein
MEHILGAIIGIGLSAACGFRIFVPFLVMGIANAAGQLTLASGFEWIGSPPAIIAFGTATVLEILAYYVPWIDNLLDTAATPAAVVAGAVVTASQLGDTSPLLKWSLAIIAGGGTSLAIQGGTATLRAASTATTGGLGNVAIATAEWMLSLLLGILAIAVPIVCLLLVLAIFAKLVSMLLKVWRRGESAVIPPGATENR